MGEVRCARCGEPEARHPVEGLGPTGKGWCSSFLRPARVGERRWSAREKGISVRVLRVGPNEGRNGGPGCLLSVERRDADGVWRQFVTERCALVTVSNWPLVECSRERPR
jgi:hypothetical protein